MVLLSGILCSWFLFKAETRKLKDELEEHRGKLDELKGAFLIL